MRGTTCNATKVYDGARDPKVLCRAAGGGCTIRQNLAWVRRGGATAAATTTTTTTTQQQQQQQLEEERRRRRRRRGEGKDKKEGKEREIVGKKPRWWFLGPPQEKTRIVVTKGNLISCTHQNRNTSRHSEHIQHTNGPRQRVCVCVVCVLYGCELPVFHLSFSFFLSLSLSLHGE